MFISCQFGKNFLGCHLRPYWSCSFGGPRVFQGFFFLKAQNKKFYAHYIWQGQQNQTTRGNHFCCRHWHHLQPLSEQVHPNGKRVSVLVRRTKENLRLEKICIGIELRKLSTKTLSLPSQHCQCQITSKPREEAFADPISVGSLCCAWGTEVGPGSEQCDYPEALRRFSGTQIEQPYCAWFLLSVCFVVIWGGGWKQREILSWSILVGLHIFLVLPIKFQDNKILQELSLSGLSISTLVWSNFDPLYCQSDQGSEINERGTENNIKSWGVRWKSIICTPSEKLPPQRKKIRKKTR